MKLANLMLNSPTKDFKYFLWGLAIAFAFDFSISISSHAETVPKPAVIERLGCPSDFNSLAHALALDLPDYLNRTYTRLGIKRLVTVASDPELQPLPVKKSDRTISNPDPSDPQQLFISVLNREIGKTQGEKQAYWLFIANTKKGWRLAMAFTRIGNAPSQDVSDGIIAISTKTWLRDRCS
jgi:hypothetical protein